MTSVYSTAEVVVPDNPPIPTGYHVLVILPKVEDKTKGGVLLPTDVKNREDIASIVAKVIAIGPDAYPENEFRFRNGPWCKEGDWILVSKYSAQAGVTTLTKRRFCGPFTSNFTSPSAFAKRV